MTEENKNVLAVQDVDAELFPHLDAEILKITTTMVKDEKGILDGKPYEVRFLGHRGLREEVQAECEKFAEKVNEVCKKYKPLGVLGKPIKYDLTPVNMSDLKAPESIYLFYLAFSIEDAKIIDEKEMTKT